MNRFTLPARIRDRIKIAYYTLKGKRPLSRGYFTYKHRYIKGAINDKAIMETFRKGTRLAPHYGHGLDERVCEYPWLLSRIPGEAKSRFLDAGSTLNFEEILEFWALKNKTITLMTLYPEKNCFWQKNISYVFGDLRNTPFKDDYFDDIACISTLEHIGLDNTLYAKNKDHKEDRPPTFTLAIKEFKRILKPNGKLFITVPFGTYENFGWFQQFDSKLVKKIIEAFNPANTFMTYYQYTRGGWNISDENTCKNIKYRNPEVKTTAGAGAVACLTLTK